MNNFQRNIMRMYAEPTSTSYSYSVIDGQSGCNAGTVNFTTIGGTITVYSTSAALGNGVTLYTTADRTVVIASSSIKSGTEVYDLTEGVITLSMVIGDAC